MRARRNQIPRIHRGLPRADHQRLGFQRVMIRIDGEPQTRLSCLDQHRPGIIDTIRRWIFIPEEHHRRCNPEKEHDATDNR